MDKLPDKVILQLFNAIELITDKRQFTQVNKRINTVTNKSMQWIINYFMTDDFRMINKYCIEKFTLELCHDKYFDKLPISYLNPKNTIIVPALAASGNLELLKIAVNNGCEFDKERCIMLASKNGNLDILKWLVKNNGCVLNDDICSSAAYGGQIHILKWLKKHGCNWNADTCKAALENDKLDVLLWMTENGYYWDKDSIRSVTLNRDPDIVKWGFTTFKQAIDLQKAKDFELRQKEELELNQKNALEALELKQKKALEAKKRRALRDKEKRLLNKVGGSGKK